MRSGRPSSDVRATSPLMILRRQANRAASEKASAKSRPSDTVPRDRQRELSRGHARRPVEIKFGTLRVRRWRLLVVSDPASRSCHREALLELRREGVDVRLSEHQPRIIPGQDANLDTTRRELEPDPPRVGGGFYPAAFRPEEDDVIRVWPRYVALERGQVRTGHGEM